MSSFIRDTAGEKVIIVIRRGGRGSREGRKGKGNFKV